TTFTKIDDKIWLGKKMLLIVVVMIDSKIHALKIVASRSEVGDNRSRMKAHSSVIEEKNLPWVAVVVDVGLRPRWIWDELDLVIMRDGLDSFTEVQCRWVRCEEDDSIVIIVRAVLGGRRRMRHGGGRWVVDSIILWGSDSPIGSHHGGHRRQP
ncbi:hypothetical protein ACLOJK_034205, partial [Asimina triloba]